MVDVHVASLGDAQLAPAILGAGPAVVVFKDEALEASSRALLDAQQAIALIDLAFLHQRMEFSN